MRRLSAALVVAAFALVVPATAQAAPDKPACQPGQHGNQQPGFKPGVCAKTTQVETAPFGRDVPVTGQSKSGRKFTGNLHIDEFAERDGKLVAIGDLTGKLRNAGKGTGSRKVTKYNVAVPVAFNQAGQVSQVACQVLNLDLGPLDLNLLGLRVQLNQIQLDITAIPGGGLLGDLLCGLAGGPAGGPLDQVAAILNGALSQILGILEPLLGGQVLAASWR